jgi:hypothetical protein
MKFFAPLSACVFLLGFSIHGGPARAATAEPMKIEVKRVDSSGSVIEMSGELNWHWSEGIETPCAQIDFDDAHLDGYKVTELQGEAVIPFAVQQTHMSGCLAGYFAVISVDEKKKPNHDSAHLSAAARSDPRPDGDARSGSGRGERTETCF